MELEPTSAAPSHPDVLNLAAQIVSAHATHNAMTIEALPDVIRSVYAALVGTAKSAAATAIERPIPAVPVKRSVFPDYIVCLEDGKRLVMLKRHLANAYGLTPDAYRQRWGLPEEYPMVAPNYARKRSFLAKVAGLGRKPGALDKSSGPPVLRVKEGVSGKRAARQATTA